MFNIKFLSQAFRRMQGTTTWLLKRYLELECLSNSWGDFMHSLLYNTCNKNMDRTPEPPVGSSDQLTQFTHQKICRANQ